MRIESLEICIDNFDDAAMVENRSAEVSRILRSIADRIDDGGIVNACDGLRLRDSNGNAVGRCNVDWTDESEAPDDCEEIEGVYGSGHTPGTVFIHAESGWYCVAGSVNVNQCPYDQLDELTDGVDVETIADCDCFTSSESIDTLEQFAQAIADMV